MLSDLSRFETLELNLQAFLLFHLADLIKLFSDSRLEKLFDDVADYFSSFTSYQAYNPDQKSFLRISCWKGLYQCLEEASLESLEYTSNMEKCMEALFTLLPAPQSVANIGVNQKDFVQEWSKAVRCLGKARQGWLLDFLQVGLFLYLWFAYSIIFTEALLSINCLTSYLLVLRSYDSILVKIFRAMSCFYYLLYRNLAEASSKQMPLSLM